MIGIILRLIVYLLSLSMFFVKREQKIAILLIYGVCLSDVPVYYIIPPIVFFISEIVYWREYFIILRKYRICIFVIVFLLGAFLVIVHSPHVRGIHGILSFIKKEIILKYIIILSPLVVITKTKSMQSIIMAATCSLIVLTFFGIINLLSGHADFVDWLSQGQKLNDIFEDAGSKFAETERFRVQAMFFNPFNYGFICLSFLLLFFCFKKERLIPQGRFLLMAFCCLFGIVFCGCRTILVCTVVGFSCYYAYTHKFISSIRYFSLFCIIIIVSYFFIPFVHEAINAKFLSIIEDDTNSSGSSLPMRIIQFSTVIYYIQDDFLFGRGYNFFNIDLNWIEGKSGVLDSDLYGLEGVYLSLLLERGLVGLFIYSFIMYKLINIFISYHILDRNTSAFCLSLIISYLVFSIMTGELDVAFITFILLGIGMKIHTLKNDNEIKFLK